MILHAQAKEGQTGFPWLVFLHGFSGDCQEWQTVGEAFQDYSRLYIDLPGHGGSADISVSGFDDVSVLLRNTLLSYNIHLVFFKYPHLNPVPTRLNSIRWGP